MSLSDVLSNRVNLCQEPQLFEQFFNTTVGNAKGLASLHEWQALSSIRSSACIMGWALISLSIYQERKKSRRIKIRIQERKKDYDDLSGQLNRLMGLGKERGTSVYVRGVCVWLLGGRRAFCLSLASFPLCVLLSCFRASLTL